MNHAMGGDPLPPHLLHPVHKSGRNPAIDPFVPDRLIDREIDAASGAERIEFPFDSSVFCEWTGSGGLLVVSVGQAVAILLPYPNPGPFDGLGKLRKRSLVLRRGRRRSARTVSTASGSAAGAISAPISWLPFATEISQPTALLSPQASSAMSSSNPVKARTALRNSGAGTLSGPSSRVMSWVISSGRVQVPYGECNRLIY